MRRAQATGVAIIVIFVIVAIIIIAIFGGWVDVSGGETTQGTQGGFWSRLFSSETITQTAFIGGTKALELSFDNLPSIRNQNQEFDIKVLAENKGEYAIPAGKARAILNNAQTFNISNPIAINPQVIRDISEGGEVEFIYPNAAYVGTVLSEEIPQTLSVGVCYPYQTSILVREVCLAPSGTNKECEPIAEKVVENSGSPVHLTSFKQLSSVYNSGEEFIDLIVKLEFEKKGSGEIYSPLASCGSVEAEHLNKIKISEIKLGTEEIDVSKSCGTNAVYLSTNDGRTTGSLRCTLSYKGIKTDAKSVLTMTLKYLHSQQLKGSIRVMPS